MNSKTALVLGATGLVGGHIVSQLTESNLYHKIIVISRRKIELNNSKVSVIIVDYDKLNSVAGEFKVDDIFCCLGTTIKKAKTKESFRKVDYDYCLEAATLAEQQGARQFLLISSIGADTKSSIFYSRVKGEVEGAIQQLNIPSILIFRPGLLLGKRNEFRVGEAILVRLAPILSLVFIGPLKKYRPIHAKKVADFMIQKAQENLNGTATLYIT